MRPARILFVAALAVTSLGTAAAATAMRGPAEDGTLSVRDGRGMVQLRMKGGVIGRLASGTLRVTDSPDETAVVVVIGEERSRPVNDRTTIYSGRNIRFRIADESRFTVRINGTKINLSAVGRGEGTLDGSGDPRHGVFFDGSYSLNDGPYKSLPDERLRFELAASPQAER